MFLWARYQSKRSIIYVFISAGYLDISWELAVKRRRRRPVCPYHTLLARGVVWPPTSCALGQPVAVVVVVCSDRSAPISRCHDPDWWSANHVVQMRMYPIRHSLVVSCLGWSIEDSTTMLPRSRVTRSRRSWWSTPKTTTIARRMQRRDRSRLVSGPR